ncbi:MAG: hypothetical protein EZS28_009926, partial [Streblomastix strix]
TFYQWDSAANINSSQILNSDTGAIKMRNGYMNLVVTEFGYNRFNKTKFPSLRSNINSTGASNISLTNTTFRDPYVDKDYTSPAWMTDKAANQFIYNPEDVFGPPFVVIPRIIGTTAVPSYHMDTSPYINVRGLYFYPFNITCQFEYTANASQKYITRAILLNEHSITCPIEQSFIKFTGGNMRVAISNDGFVFSNAITTNFLFSFDCGVIIDRSLKIALIVLCAVAGGIAIIIIIFLLVLFIINYNSVENRTIRKENEQREVERKQQAEEQKKETDAEQANEAQRENRQRDPGQGQAQGSQQDPGSGSRPLLGQSSQSNLSNDVIQPKKSGGASAANDADGTPGDSPVPEDD